jgi:hypothetical protein
MAEQWSASHRDELSEWLTVEPMVSWVTLGHHFGVHQTTVQREVDHNGGRFGYRPASAQQAADKARRRPRPRRLCETRTAAWSGHRRAEAGPVPRGDLGRPGGRGCQRADLCRDDLPSDLRRCVGRQAQPNVAGGAGDPGDPARPVTPTSARHWRTSGCGPVRWATAARSATGKPTI